MNCINDLQFVSLVDGTMNDDEVERWLHHCESCDTCAKRLDLGIGLDQVIQEVFALPMVDTLPQQVDRAESTIKRSVSSQFIIQALISIAASIALLCAIATLSMKNHGEIAATGNASSLRPSISENKTRIFDRETIVVTESGEDDSFALFMVYPTLPEVVSNDESSIEQSTTLIAGVH